MSNSCELCNNPGGELIWQDDACRVVRVNDQDYPGFCRVILNKHVKEMTDLSRFQQGNLMSVVFAVEQCIRTVMKPDKINLASFGNKTPHVHWHIIPRYESDRHFPNSIWGASTRESMAQQIDNQTALALKAAIQKALG